MAKAPINVSISGDYNDKDVKRAMKDLGSLQKEGSKTGKSFVDSFKDIGAKVAVAGAAIAGIGVVVNKAIQSASALSEAQSKVTQVFGDQADSIFNWGKTSAQAFGQSETQALSAVGTYGNLLQAFGITAEKASDMSKAMVELAADLASFNDTSIEDALQALQSGLSGETEPLKRYGVALNDARLKTEALALGIYEGTGALSVAAKAQASYALILKDTTLAQGDFGRTSDGLANQQRILQAQFDNLITQLGGFLLPIAVKVVQALNGMVEMAQRVTTAISENKAAVILVTVAVGAFTAALVVQRAALTASSVAFAVNVVASKLLVGAINLTTTAIVAMSAAMRLIPFVAIATAAAAFVLVLDKGAKSHKEYITQTENNLRSTNRLRDANGKFTREAVALGLAMRGSRGALQDNRNAISGTAAAAIAAGNAMGSTLTPNTYAAGDAADDAAKSYYDLYLSIFQARRAASDLANTSGTVSSAIAQGFTKPFLDGVGAMASQYGKVEKAFKGASGSAGAVNKELDELSTKKQKRMDALKELAETAKSSMKEMRDSVYSTVSGWLDLGNAFDTYKARQTAVTETLMALEEQRKTMTDASTQDQKDKLQELADAHERAKGAAASGAQSIVAEFNEQAKKFGEFGAKLQELLKAGLNKTSFMQIIGMGYERGGEVVDSYLKGNTSELVKQTNSTMAEYDKLSQSIAEESSRAFYQAGLQSALALLKAFTAALGKGGSARREMKAIIKDLESELQINITSNVATPSGGTSSFTPVAMPASSGGAYDFGPITGIPDLPAGGFDFSAWGGLGFGAFANGGLVTGPMVGLVGEAGPELIVPLDKVGRMGGTNISLTVNAGLGTDGAEVGRKIVDAIASYERRNGRVYASA